MNFFRSRARWKRLPALARVIDSTFIDRESTFTRERFLAARYRPLGKEADYARAKEDNAVSSYAPLVKYRSLSSPLNNNNTALNRRVHVCVRPYLV